MPPKSKKPAAEPEAAAPVEDAAVIPDATVEDAAVEDAAAANAADEVVAFENRAARRARGKKSGQVSEGGKPQHLSGRGPVTGPRMYGRRRSG